MRGTQFLVAASANSDHPCHYMLTHQSTPRRIKSPQALYTGLNTIPQHSHSHIHTHFTNIAIQKLGINTILGTPLPEPALPWADRVHLSRLCCGHHTALANLLKRIDDSIDKVCTHCSTNTHSLTHIMTHCPTLMHIRAQHNISSLLYLWHSSANCFDFAQGIGLAQTDELKTDNNNSTLETAILHPSTDSPISLFHCSHQHIWDCHSATSSNFRIATVTQLLLPLTRWPLPHCHCFHKQAWQCYPATTLINTLATATQTLSSPKHLPLLPCNAPTNLPLPPCHCSYQPTWHCHCYHQLTCQSCSHGSN